jgi:hypothetical protein
LTGQRFDLARQPLDTCIQPAPVSRQILDDAQHARQQHIGARREDTRQLGPQGMQALPYGDAPLQQERTDLIDDAGTLTTNRSRTRCSARKSSWSAVLVATNFMVGRCTASAIASASRKSFFRPFDKDASYCP